MFDASQGTLLAEARSTDEPPAARSRASCGVLRHPAASRGAASDLATATRTVPRGTGPTDRRREPGVRLELWLSHVRYHRTRDRALLAELVREYEPYALALAHRMHRNREPIEDLEQIAREGLIASLDRFDPEFGIPFPAFATPTVLGALRRHFRDHGWAIRVPRRVHEITIARHRSADRLTGQLGRTPTSEEIAQDLGIPVEVLVQAEGAAVARTPVSFDAPVGSDGITIGDLVAEPDAGLLSSDNHLALRDALATLGRRDREILDLYFVKELTQSEIATRFGVSQMQISRWLTNTIGRLRGQMVCG